MTGALEKIFHDNSYIVRIVPMANSAMFSCGLGNPVSILVAGCGSAEFVKEYSKLYSETAKAQNFEVKLKGDWFYFGSPDAVTLFESIDLNKEYQYMSNNHFKMNDEAEEIEMENLPITNEDDYISIYAELPFWGKKVRIELDSESKEDVAFAERQIALISALSTETYVELCRHTIDYASDFIDSVGENLSDYFEEEEEEINEENLSEMASELERWFSSEEAENIKNKLKSKIATDKSITSQRLLYLVGECVLDLGYSEDNFHHIWPTVQKDLEQNPLHIMRFISLQSISFERLMDGGEEVLAAKLYFDCEWEVEHGLSWAIVDKKGVWVSDVSAGYGVELKSLDYEYYNQDGNYCFHKSIY